MPASSSAEVRFNHAAYVREYGRSKGAEPVKGENFRCEVCRQIKPKTGKCQRWCQGCKAEGVRRYKTAKRREDGAGEVGAIYSCENCKVEYTRVHLRQKYCERCSALSAKDGIPKYRKRQSAYQSARNKVRRQTIPSVAIAERISAQIGQALRGKKKGRKWESIVGYTVEELMSHIERQFLKGMSWENRSEWHIDHVVPVTSFTFTRLDDPEVRRAWALPNLRPLWAEDNIRKSNKREYLI